MAQIVPAANTEPTFISTTISGSIVSGSVTPILDARCNGTVVYTTGTTISGMRFVSDATTNLIREAPSQGIISSSTLLYASQMDATTGMYTVVNNGSISSGYLVYRFQPEDRILVEKRNREQQKKRLHAIHRAKGSIKRALRLMDNVGFGDDIRVFLGGDDIEISHPASMFKFLLTKHNGPTLIERTIHGGFSTPYNLRLFTKTNVHVANLCVVLQDTPVLDQILAVSMFIKTGDEEHILQQANWSHLTDDEDTLLRIVVERPELRRKFRHHRFSNMEIQDIFTS